MVVAVEYWKTSDSIHSQGLLRCIYTRVKAKAKAMLRQLGSKGIQFTVYIKATAAATKIKERNRFRFRSSISEPLV